jgi:hypothetical protein
MAISQFHGALSLVNVPVNDLIIVQAGMAIARVQTAR